MKDANDLAPLLRGLLSTRIMSLDTGGISPTSSGRASPIPKRWRSKNASGMVVVYAQCCFLLLMLPDEPPRGDKAYKRYSNSVDRSLSLFDTSLLEWADYISFLSRLLKVREILPFWRRRAIAENEAVNTSTSSKYNSGTLQVYCGQTFGPMLESSLAVRCPPEGSRGLCLHIFYDWKRCAFKRPFAVSAWSLVHFVLRSALCTNAFFGLA